MRVLLPLDRLFLGFLTNGKVYNAFGELVHVARARRACVAHAREYGAIRQPLQRRSGTPSVKLSHYPAARSDRTPRHSFAELAQSTLKAGISFERRT
jgi:hypothetical protein